MTVALFHHGIEFFEIIDGERMILRHFDLTVVTADAREGLQSQIQGEDLIQHPDGVDIVAEMPASVPVVQIVQEHFTRMGEGGVADVVTQGDCLDQIQVQIQRASDGTGDAADQLHMETASCDIVIFHQGENLGLVAVAVVVGAVHDLIHVLDKGRPPYSGQVGIQGNAAERHAVRRAYGRGGMVLAVVCNSFGKTCRDFFKFRHGNTSLFWQYNIIQ